jgi:hypothetical protein
MENLTNYLLKMHEGGIFDKPKVVTAVTIFNYIFLQKPDLRLKPYL